MKKIILAFIFIFPAIFSIGKENAEFDSLTAHISQEKHLSFMDEVLSSELVLVLDKNKNIRWETLSPYKAVSLYKGGKLQNFEKSNESWVELKSAVDIVMGEVLKKMLSVFTASLTETPAGFSSSKDGAKLRLSPTDSNIKKYIEYVDVLLDEKGLYPKKLRYSLSMATAPFSK